MARKAASRLPIATTRKTTRHCKTDKPRAQPRATRRAARAVEGRAEGAGAHECDVGMKGDDAAVVAEPLVDDASILDAGATPAVRACGRKRGRVRLAAVRLSETDVATPPPSARFRSIPAAPATEGELTHMLDTQYDAKKRISAGDNKEDPSATARDKHGTKYAKGTSHKHVKKETKDKKTDKKDKKD